MQIEKHSSLKIISLELEVYLYTEIDFDHVNKKPNNFCLILFYNRHSKKIPILRIDTAHGKPHIHKFYTQNNIVEKFEEEISPQVYEKAKQFIYSNWKTFLETYKRKDLK